MAGVGASSVEGRGVEAQGAFRGGHGFNISDLAVRNAAHHLRVEGGEQRVEITAARGGKLIAWAKGADGSVIRLMQPA